MSQREKTKFNLYLNPSKYEKTAKSDNKAALISDVSFLYIKRKGSRGDFGHVAIGGGAEGLVGCLSLSSGDEHSFFSEGHLPDVADTTSGTDVAPELPWGQRGAGSRLALLSPF